MFLVLGLGESPRSLVSVHGWAGLWHQALVPQYASNVENWEQLICNVDGACQCLCVARSCFNFLRCWISEPLARLSSNHLLRGYDARVEDYDLGLQIYLESGAHAGPDEVAGPVLTRKLQEA